MLNLNDSWKNQGAWWFTSTIFRGRFEGQIGEDVTKKLDIMQPLFTKRPNPQPQQGQ